MAKFVILSKQGSVILPEQFDTRGGAEAYIASFPENEQKYYSIIPIVPCTPIYIFQVNPNDKDWDDIKDLEEI